VSPRPTINLSAQAARQLSIVDGYQGVYTTSGGQTPAS
jgi:hypothetical protein